MCTDVRMPNHVLSLECPATCAKANGALMIEQDSIDHECLKSCTGEPETCQDWLNMTYRVGGCATGCTPDFKQFYRPNLDCKHTIAVGDLVSVVPTSGPDAEGCVISVLGSVALVNIGQVSKTANINRLLLSRRAHPKCLQQQPTKPVEAPPANSLQAVINGPTQVSAKSCDPVTLDAYQSTNYGPASALTYLWKVPAALANETTFLRSPTLTFKTLPPGSHAFGLSVSNGTHSARAAEFEMRVVPDYLPVVTMACPKSVCTRANVDEYEIQVNLNEQTMLMTDVELATACQGKVDIGGGELPPLNWTQFESATSLRISTNQWTPLKVRCCMRVCYRHALPFCL